MRTSRFVPLLLVAGLLGLASCSEPEPQPTPAQIRAQVSRLLPVTLRDRAAWAQDIQVAFTSLGIRPVPPNLCAALAVIEQETGYNPDPAVPGLARIARKEIENRAGNLGVPRFVVAAALEMAAPDGRPYSEHLAAVRTERDLSNLYEGLIEKVPLGRRLLGRANPVRTGGAMQVGIAFAEAFADARPYPYPVAGSIRDEVFSRRGGVYFGIAHLLAYETSYPHLRYRFADFNAGLYASRNVAFQNALAIASGMPVELDGDVIAHGQGRNHVGQTEQAARTLTPVLGIEDAEIRRALKLGHSLRFEETTLYREVFAMAERQAGKPLPRAMMPSIRLQSPKITRRLTTEWFAKRVEKRYRQCMARAG